MAALSAGAHRSNTPCEFRHRRVLNPRRDSVEKRAAWRCEP